MNKEKLVFRCNECDHQCKLEVRYDSKAIRAKEIMDGFRAFMCRLLEHA